MYHKIKNRPHTTDKIIPMVIRSADSTPTRGAGHDSIQYGYAADYLPYVASLHGAI